MNGYLDDYCTVSNNNSTYVYNLGSMFFFIKWNKQAKILRYSRPLSNDFNLAN